MYKEVFWARPNFHVKSETSSAGIEIIFNGEAHSFLPNILEPYFFKSRQKTSILALI